MQRRQADAFSPFFASLTLREKLFIVNNLSKRCFFVKKIVHFCGSFLMKVVWTSIDLRFFAVYASNTPHQTRSLEGFIDCLYERLNFAVDGGWAQWGPWTSCSPLCGHPSKKKRYRGCHDPAPQFGGKNCRGQKPDQENQEESMECKHNPPCPDAIRSS